MKNIEALGILLQESTTNTTPERNLWFAVIYRAMKDYCFFFDKLNQPDYSFPYNHKSSKRAYKNYYHKAIAEFSRMRMWFNNDQPEPFNLIYITNMLYDDGDGVAQQIRKQANAFLMQHVQEIEEANKYPDLLIHLKTVLASDVIIPNQDINITKYKKFKYYLN